MKRFLSFTFVLVGTALAVAAGSDTPTPGPLDEEVNLMAKDTAQEVASRAKQDRPHGESNLVAKDTAQEVASRAKQDRPHGESNETISQPKRIEDSYPLKGDDERYKSVKGLQQLTVDLLALYNMYKEAHWNLTGPLYLQLHEYYDQQAAFYLLQADAFAERVLHLGSSVDGRYSTIVRTTKLPEMPAGYMTDNESIKLMLDRVTVLQKEIYQLIRETEDSDPPTSNKLQDLGYSLDKNLWQLRVHLQRPGSGGQDLPWVSHQGRENPSR